MGSQFRYCGCCGGEQPFETPPCRDGHGVDCPERVCTGCGAALLVDPPRTDPEAVALPHRIDAA